MNSSEAIEPQLKELTVMFSSELGANALELRFVSAMREDLDGQQAGYA